MSGGTKSAVAYATMLAAVLVCGRVSWVAQGPQTQAQAPSGGEVIGSGHFSPMVTDLNNIFLVLNDRPAGAPQGRGRGNP